MKYKVRMQDRGPIGGWHGKISLDDGVTWIQLRKYVGGGLVAFDSKKQLLREANKEAHRQQPRRVATHLQIATPGSSL